MKELNQKEENGEDKGVGGGDRATPALFKLRDAQSPSPHSNLHFWVTRDI